MTPRQTAVFRYIHKGAIVSSAVAPITTRNGIVTTTGRAEGTCKRRWIGKGCRFDPSTGEQPGQTQGWVLDPASIIEERTVQP